MSGTGSLEALFKIDSTGAQASMNSAEVTMTRALESMKRQFIAVSVRVKELETGTKSLNQGASMAKATQEIVNYGKAAEFTAKQISQANRLLPQQMTDIVTSLAGGQNPLLVFIQQGGQIKDMFGGIGGAARALASFITPLSIVMTALAGAAGLVGAGLYFGREESNKLRDSLALSGNAAGLTADRFALVAKRASEISGQTVGAARDIVMVLAASGKTTTDLIESQTKAVARIADLSGKSAVELAEKFTSQLKAPAKFAADLNESYNFLTIAQFKRIQQLEKEGELAAAAALTNDLLTKSLEGQRQNLGYLETSLEAASKGWATFWNAVKGLGRDATTLEQLQGLRKELDDRTARGPLNSTTEEAFRKGNDRLRERIMLLAEQSKQESTAAQRASDDALKVKKEIEKAMAKPGAEPKKNKDKIGPPTFDEMFPAANVGNIQKEQQDNISARGAMAARERADYETIRKEEQRQNIEDMQNKAAAAKKSMEELAKHGAAQVKFFEDSVISLVKNGSAGFRDLFATMAEEYLRNIIRMVAQKNLLDQNGAFVGWATGLSNMASAVGSFFGGTGHAGGLDYVPYDGYPAVLHKGERVQTAIEASSGRGGNAGPVIDNSINGLQVGNGVSRAEMFAAIKQAQGMQEQRMRRLSREGVFSS